MPPDNQDSSPGSVTHLLRKIHYKDDQTTQDVFNFYFYGLARRAGFILETMGGTRISNGEDLAIQVMTAFLRDAAEGRFGVLQSRRDVWNLLNKRIRLRAINLIRDEQRLKSHEQPNANRKHQIDDIPDFDAVVDSSLDEKAMQLVHEELIEQLSDPLEKEIASLLLEGSGVREIAETLRVSHATVYRKIKSVRSKWQPH